MTEKYFLGSFSPKGFKGNFSEIIDSEGYKTVILKGGAGTGKSSLMKKTAKHFENKEDIALFYCSSDPDSLDAIVLKKRKRIIVDGTAPHSFEPKYPAVKEKIINLGDYWDEKKLCEKAEEIIKTSNEHKKLMERTKRYVSALSSIFTDTYSIAEEALLKKKQRGFVERLMKKLALRKSEKRGKCSVLQLSALTPEGYKTFLSTLDGFEVYILRDSFFAGSDSILRELSEAFSARGKNVYISPCNMFEASVYEHIIIPELKLAFITSDPLTEIKLENAKPINVHRFYDKQVLSARKSRLRLNKKACADLTAEASDTMKTALKVHDKLEKYYVLAMDFEKVRKKCDELISEFDSV